MCKKSGFFVSPTHLVGFRRGSFGRRVSFLKDDADFRQLVSVICGDGVDQSAGFLCSLFESEGSGRGRWA